MATAIFWGMPAHGHTNPTLPLVTELVRCGEQVFYYSLDEFQPAIARTGATFCRYGTDFPLFQVLTDPLDPAKLTYGLAFTSQWVLDHLLTEVHALKPDYLIFDSFCPWGRFIAQMLHLPTVCSQTNLALPFRMLLKHPLAALSMLRTVGTGEYHRQSQTILKDLSKNYRLKNLRPLDLLNTTGMLNILYTSQMVQPYAGSFDPERYKFVGPALLPRPEAPAFPFEMLEPGKPLLYISLGTAFNTRPDFFRACFEAFERGDWQVVMVAGQHISQETLGAAPANFIVQAFVPQLELLPRTTLFLTHGGMNSVNEALYYYVPLVVVPQGADQPWVARRIEELGAGLRLSPKQLTAQRLRHAAQEILSQPAYAQAAARVGESLHSAGGYRKAAEEILAFLRVQGIT